MGRLRVILATVITLTLSLIDAARRNPEFAHMIRKQVLAVVPKQYKAEANTWLCRILDIRAEVISYEHKRPYQHRRNKAQHNDGGGDEPGDHQLDD